MQIEYILIIVFFLSVLFSIVGIGGASIYVPLFYFFGIEMSDAIIIGLMMNILTTIVNNIVFYKQKIKISKSKNETKAIIGLFFGILIGSVFGTYFFKTAPIKILKIILGIILVFASYYMIKNNELKKIDNKKDHKTKISKINYFLFGIGVGAIAGCIGIGGGIFLVPFLTHQTNDIKKAIFTSYAAVFFASFSALILRFILNNADFSFDYMLAIALGLIAILGSYIGSHLIATNKIKTQTLKKIFGLVLIVFAIKLLAEVF
jgi:uncharacterized membrane protein YfcA